MSMLAAPRLKQKVINLRAKNNVWSNDATKFGQRMLEKMGWSSGKGLGARENGIVEHVVARYKNDEKGLGFQDKSDQWTKHEDDFNAVLAKLSGGSNNTDEPLHSGISLEERSKKSKVRIHYHKFTRGKDLTQYSEKDLANIFGRKSLKKEVKADEFKNDTKPSALVFTEKGSMEDYFKSKLAALKSKEKVSELNHDEAGQDVDYKFKGFSGTNYEETYQGFGYPSSPHNNNDSVAQNESGKSDKEAKKSKNKMKSKHKHEIPENEFAFENVKPMFESDNIAIQETAQEQQIEKKVKKCKKKRKSVEEEEPVIEACEKVNPAADSYNIAIRESAQEQQIKKKVKKCKKKRKSVEEEEPVIKTCEKVHPTADSYNIAIRESTQEQQIENKVKKCKKKKKLVEEEEPVIETCEKVLATAESDNIATQQSEWESLIDKKVKKSKKKSVEQLEPVFETYKLVHITADNDNISTQESKRDQITDKTVKKSKKKSVEEVEPVIELCEPEEPPPKKKKKKSRKDPQDIPENILDQEGDEPLKKKKKKNKNT